MVDSRSNRRSFGTLAFAACLALAAGCNSVSRYGDDEKPRFTLWENAVEAFEKRDKEYPPARHGIVFVGSSSIRLWDTDKSFPQLGILNRGFGGSELSHSVHFAPRIVTKYEPRLVVLYAGDNDLAFGKTPEQVYADFQAFDRAVHQPLPRTKIAFISIKPSVRRRTLVEKTQKTNTLIEEYCKKDDRLIYIDVFKPMLTEDGKPRPELFQKDGLHLNEKGYELWTGLVKPVLIQ